MNQWGTLGNKVIVVSVCAVFETPHQLYEEVKDFESLHITVEEYLVDYNSESKQPMHLVMFRDAIEHVSRISRIIR